MYRILYGLNFISGVMVKFVKNLPNYLPECHFTLSPAVYALSGVSVSLISFSITILFSCPIDGSETLLWSLHSLLELLLNIFFMAYLPSVFGFSRGTELTERMSMCE